MKRDFINTIIEFELEFSNLLLGCEIVTHKIQIGENEIGLILLVTDSERNINPQIRPSWCQGVSACAILFDKSNLENFNAVEGFYNE
ncbi:MAG: hypothetical protein ACFE9L_16970 [Candidatus Hodarchaeota archaeon]